MKAAAAVFVFYLLLNIDVSNVLGQEFSYDGNRGPEHWGEQYDRCSGKHQSPINIDDLYVQEREFDPLVVERFDETPKSVRLINNGHTVLVKMAFEGDQVPTVHGGPLGENTTYRFSQFHFHWGENDTVGSEDLINNNSYPAELHVVMTNAKYPNFETAVGMSDGLAVFAFFLEIVRRDNPKYVEFTELLKKVPNKGMTAEFPTPQKLKDFLTYDLVNYYTYIGSLTTPPCNEDVIWLDFITPILISEQQIKNFRDLSVDEKLLVNNFRPTQPINDRVIYMARLPPYQQTLASAIPFVDADNGAQHLGITTAVLMWLCGINILFIIWL